MYKYHLFIIKQDAYKIYRNNPYILYRSLLNLKNIGRYDFRYGISIYKQICEHFSIKLLNNYITSKYSSKYINHNLIKINSIIEKTYVNLNYSNAIILSNKMYPEILKVFNIYNRYIFLCDFNNKKYYWLKDIIKKCKNL